MANGLLAPNNPKKITPFQAELYKKFATAHVTKIWDYPERFAGTKAELIAELKAGKTFRFIWEDIEVRYCSIGQILMAHPDILAHPDSTYNKNMLKGFKFLMYSIEIV